MAVSEINSYLFDGRNSCIILTISLKMSLITFDDSRSNFAILFDQFDV